MGVVESETHFFFRMILLVLYAPVFYILWAFGFKQWEERPRPLQEWFHFLMQAQGTFWIGILIIIGFAIEIYFLMQGGNLEPYVWHPNDLLSLNILPFFTHLFLHAGLGHLVGNLLALLAFGRAVE